MVNLVDKLASLILKQVESSSRYYFSDSRNREDFAAFKNVACSSLFAWSLVWFGILYLGECFYDENFRLVFTRLGVDKEYSKYKHFVIFLFSFKGSLMWLCN